LCFECSTEYKINKMQIPDLPLNLQAMHETSNEIKNMKVDISKIALISRQSGNMVPATFLKAFDECRFLYRTRKTTKPEKIRCSYQHIFMENVAAELNITLEYFSDAYASSRNYLLGKNFTSVSILGLWNWERLEYWINSTHFYNPLIVHSEFRKFLYCIKSHDHEPFSFLFWTIPLDSLSWILIGISILALAIQLRGHLLQICGILLRQPTAIVKNNKMLIIFIFGAIVFTYGYESVISSILIVPPSFKVFSTLNELLNNGYKIIGYNENAKNPELQELFARENITMPVKSAMVEGSSFIADVEKILAQIQCNVTFHEPEHEAHYVTSIIEAILPGMIKCHVTKDTVLPDQTVYFFFGYWRKSFAALGLRMNEAGLITMFRSYTIYIAVLLITAEQRLRGFSSLDLNRGLALKVSDWKILSIFIVWGSLLGLALVVFLVETAFPAVAKYALQGRSRLSAYLVAKIELNLSPMLAYAKSKISWFRWLLCLFVPRSKKIGVLYK